MNEEPEILSFVKALASADRLRIVGVLVRGKATQSDIAEQLHLPARDVFNHLAFLVQVGIINEADGFYDLNGKAIESFARGQFEGKRPTFEGKEQKSEDVRKVLKNFLNADGTLTPHGLLLSTDYLIVSFGEDSQGEIYVVDYNGRVGMITRAGTSEESGQSACDTSRC